MTYQKPEGLPEKIQHFIDGKFDDSIGGAEFEVIEPVSNETSTMSASAQKEAVDLAVAAHRTRENPAGSTLPIEFGERATLGVSPDGARVKRPREGRSVGREHLSLIHISEPTRPY